ncbi:hypothetical protein ScPMuIL_018327 [Solemya velum]
MNKNMTIILALVLVCALATWSAEAAEMSMTDCLTRYKNCRSTVRSAMRIRLCILEFAKCSAPVYLRQSGLQMSIDDIIKLNYNNLIRKKQ